MKILLSILAIASVWNSVARESIQFSKQTVESYLSTMKPSYTNKVALTAGEVSAKPVIPIFDDLMRLLKQDVERVVLTANSAKPSAN